MEEHRKNALSLLEVFAAVVILAVVAASTIASLRTKSDQELADQEIATLNSESQAYFLELGVYPTDSARLAGSGDMANTTTEEKNRITRIKNEYSYSASTGVFTQK